MGTAESDIKKEQKTSAQTHKIAGADVFFIKKYLDKQITMWYNVFAKQSLILYNKEYVFLFR